jgi:hypothetical protein
MSDEIDSTRIEPPLTTLEGGGAVWLSGQAAQRFAAEVRKLWDQHSSLEAERDELRRAINTIATYSSPDELKGEAEDIGLDDDEVIEMAYENVLDHAKKAQRKSAQQEGGGDG